MKSGEFGRVMDKTIRCPWVLKTWCWSLREIRAREENMDVDRIMEE